MFVVGKPGLTGMSYECLSDKSLILVLVYHVYGENEARVSCIFCQWFMANSSVCPLLIEKPGFLAMRLDCWDFVDLQATQEEGIGQVHVGLHESSGRVQSSLNLPLTKMTIFQFETSPTNYQRVGKSWQVQQNDARDIQ